MNLVTNQMYLSNTPLDHISELTELSEDEILEIVGVFKAHSIRAGQVRGELVEYADGNIVIRHHFTKKVLWSLK